MNQKPESSHRILVRNIETLSSGRYAVEKYIFDYRLLDGSWQQLSREVHWRGDSAAVLPFCPQRGTVLLTRQFRLPVFVNGRSDGMMIEVPGGLLSGDTPANGVRRETEEETGFGIENVEEVFSAYMSPTLLTERVHFFVAEYDSAHRISGGGGSASEGEDIEVLEISLDEAFAMIQQGTIIDGKTILLLLYTKLKNLMNK